MYDGLEIVVVSKQSALLQVTVTTCLDLIESLLAHLDAYGYLLEYHLMVIIILGFFCP